MADVGAPGREASELVTHKYGLIACGLVFVYAAYTGALVIALLVGGLALIAGIGTLSSWLSIWRVSLVRSLSSNCAFPGDSLTVRYVLENRKPLPAPWLEVAEPVVRGLEVTDPGTEKRLLHLAWFRRVRWDRTLLCRRRGSYRLESSQLIGGDPYGLTSREAVMGGCEELLVYPRLLPLDQIPLPARALLGQQRPPRSLFEDPSRLAGVRAYQPGDPLNRIHWKVTARHGSLHSKVLEPSTTPTIALVLAIDPSAMGHPDDDESVEYAISVVASLAHLAVESGWSVGVFSGGHPEVALLPAAGRQHTMLILQSLARLDKPDLGWRRALAVQRSHLPSGATLVFVAPALSEVVLENVADVASGGHAITLVQTNGLGPGIDKIGPWPVFHAGQGQAVS
jgi:uncharacterized protein (DUF58 family)